MKIRSSIILSLIIVTLLVLATALPTLAATTIVVTPATTPTDTDNDFTRIQNAVASATNGDVIDLQGTFNWTEPFALADYTASFSTSRDGDIRGVEIPSGVNNLTITSSTANAHIIGAGDMNDGSLKFSAFMFADDGNSTLGNTNLTIEKLNIDDFEGAITLGWNATGTFNGTMIRNNTIVVSGDNGDATDWIQNMAIYFWVGQNQTMQDNLITFQADGTRTVGYSGPKKGASFGFQNGTSGGTGYTGLQIKNNTFQVGATSTGVGGEETYGIWENSHNDDNGSVITLSGNSFLGRAGDDFDHAFLLSSQTTGLSITGNSLNGVDDVFLATKSQGHSVGDRYTFSNNTLTSVGGADGIFLQNVTNDLTPIHVTLNWDINNSVDGETGIRGLNELSTQATHASRPASAATDIAAVFGQGPQTTTAVDDNWGTPGRFTDPDGIGTGAGPVAYGFNTYTTVQAGVNAVATDGTVNVAAGTYTEQVVIDKNLTLQGAGAASATIVAPDVVPTCFTVSGNAKRPIVCVKDSAAATIDGFTIDGAGKGNANYQFVGVGFHNAGGTLQNSTVKDIRDTPFSGAQHGVAVYSYNEDGVNRTINVWDNTIVGFQKNGTALNASDTTPLTVDVRRNVVTGYGATTVTAQNGIQVWTDLGTGVVANNTVTGIAYSGSGWVASSILNYYADLNITGNTVTNGHVGLYNIDGVATIDDNIFSIVKEGGYGYGIIATDPPEAQPSPYEPVTTSTYKPNAPQAPSALLNVTVTNNDVTFSGPDNTATYGIEADGGYGPDNLALTIDNNVVSGFDVGIELYACQTGCDAGAITSATAHGNSVAGNTIGVRSNLGFTVDAEKNWWGAVSGPGTVGSGTGSQVSTSIDYAPWCINAACTAFSSDNPIIIPPTMSPADVQSIINLAAPGTTLVFEPGIFSTPVGGYIVTQPGLTFQLSVGTIIRPSSPCITVLANDTTITGGVCEPSNGSDGILTGAAISNLVIKNMEIRNGAGTSDGIHLGYDVTNLQILDNYIHNMGGDGIEYASGTTVSGVHEVQGNLFQSNAGFGVNNASANSYVVEYNSWNDIAGPTGTNGDNAAGLLDFTPWTHVGLSMISSGSPVADKVAVGAQIVYTVSMDASEVWGADFDLRYDSTRLSVVSATNGGAFTQAGLCTIDTATPGVISFCGSRTGSALNGAAQTVFQVTFQGVTAGVVPLNLDEASDSFTMAPPSGASTNIYAAALADGSVEVFGVFNVTGRIDLQGRANDSGAVMTFNVGTNQGYGTYAFGASNYWGAISRSGVVQDTYSIVVSMPRYLDVTIDSSKTANISADRLLSTLTLWGGDANDDGVIGLGDATIIGGLYGTTGDSAGDINADSVVNIQDLALMGGNFDKTSAAGVTAGYAGWTP